MRIVAVGGPKGGVGKSTLCVSMATACSRAGHRVLVVDADENRSSIDWIESADEAIPVDVASGRDVGELVSLRDVQGYDLVFVDLPGAREGAFTALLGDSNGRPVPDVLVTPTGEALMDLRPTIRVLSGEVVPLGLPYLLVLNRVAPEAMRRMPDRQEQLRSIGLVVADTVVRRLVAYDEALERHLTVFNHGGPHSYARVAEKDVERLTGEVLGLVGMTLEGTN